MPLIEDYAVIGDTCTAALVGRDGAIDWLCMPRFDSAACFAALLGDGGNGRWSIAPKQAPRRTRRRYRPDTLILETEFETDGGTVTLIDFMPIATDPAKADVVRLIRGDSGSVEMTVDAVFRFDYGSVVPWLQRCEDGVRVVAGPDALRLKTDVPLRNEDFHTRAEITVRAGETVAFHLGWTPSHLAAEPAPDPVAKLAETEAWWRDWSARCTYQGRWREAVLRSLITLKALTYAPTGGTVAAVTTSLPEAVGGPRNWDYRFCWVRDATFLLYALAISGYREEAAAWRDWLFRAVAGSPSQLQIMYGLAGERRLTETEIPWLAGYENSRPVRTGNEAYRQFQLDVFGEVLDAFYVDRNHNVEGAKETSDLVQLLLDRLERDWVKPDCGIWEVRGPPRHFTHSKVMAWVAVDRGVKLIERYGFDGDGDRWRALRQRIHDEICEKGFDAERNSFTQYYGGRTLDAALLMMPLMRFLPPEDPRMVGTVDAVRRQLMVDGLVMRYDSETGVDGFTAPEAAFLPCSFWLADNLAMSGKAGEAEALFERLLGLRNDVGLLAEEYDSRARRMLGNFPQALTHVALVNTAFNLTYGREATRSHAAR